MRPTFRRPSAKENRLIYLEAHQYDGHLDRFVGTAKDYDWKTIRGAVAGSVHTVTSGFGIDPAIRGGLGKLDPNNRNKGVPAYRGVFGFGGKTVENTVGTFNHLIHLRVPSAVGGVINIVGDGISDGTDFLTGHRHNPPPHLSRVATNN